jgi:hypothetical protein
MRRVFRELIGRIIEAYVDDIVVKSKKTGDLVPNLTEVFAKLRQHGVKLNPEKCVFGVPRGILFGFVVSKHGIEANPEKISSIMDMGPIKNLKGVQRVTGCLAALSRFIARLGERSLPLYKLMKKSDHFTWTPEAQEALDSLKNILKSPPILTALTTEEPMLLYISATTQVVSAVLVVEREEPRRSEKVQRPVYLVVRYSPTPRRATHRFAETCVRNLDDQTQAPTLIRRTSHHRGVQVSTQGGHPKPQGRRKDRQMDTQVDGAKYHVCFAQRDQVPSTRGFRGRVDGDANSTSEKSSMRLGSCTSMARS